jgi:hypothetical protein
MRSAVAVCCQGQDANATLKGDICALQTCQLPLQYNGRDVRSCMSYQGRTGCWAQAGKWIPCGPDAGATGPAAKVIGTCCNTKGSAPDNCKP